EFLETGTAVQKAAILFFTTSFSEFPEEFRKVCLQLLSDEEIEIRARALETLNARDIALPVDRFEQVRRLSEGSTDRFTKAECVAAMIFMNSKEVDTYLFSSMLNFRGMPFTDSMARAIRAKLSAPQPENEAAYSVMVGFALSSKIGERAFETL